MDPKASVLPTTPQRLAKITGHCIVPSYSGWSILVNSILDNWKRKPYILFKSFHYGGIIYY